jgi:hypothetical protein
MLAVGAGNVGYIGLVSKTSIISRGCGGNWV